MKLTSQETYKSITNNELRIMHTSLLFFCLIHIAYCLILAWRPPTLGTFGKLFFLNFLYFFLCCYPITFFASNLKTNFAIFHIHVNILQKQIRMHIFLFSLLAFYFSRLHISSRSHHLLEGNGSDRLQSLHRIPHTSRLLFPLS